MINNYKGISDVESYNKVIQKLRTFFLSKGFVEVCVQDRLSILAACEDPTTVATYKYAGKVWPLPQTGQMWLEYELLSKPHLKGVFCITTSYRAEKNPVPGRHKIIFPMFEFESAGGITELRKLETELLVHLGFKKNKIIFKKFDEVAKKYKVREISYKQERKMEKDYSPSVLLEQFPIYTSPFWNMKKNGDHANKIDVILCGNETIGSAERSSDVVEMKKQFETISDGKYAKLLYKLFGKQRVQNELNEFLKLKFFPRFGGGIGVSRLIDAMQKQQLI
jgi:aspartyl/asparaginyl-tRNA synthetase